MEREACRAGWDFVSVPTRVRNTVSAIKMGRLPRWRVSSQPGFVNEFAFHSSEKTDRIVDCEACPACGEDTRIPSACNSYIFWLLRHQYHVTRHQDEVNIWAAVKDVEMGLKLIDCVRPLADDCRQTCIYTNG
jgi:hypothetical protein